jgi:hypothetical protein
MFTGHYNKVMKVKGVSQIKIKAIDEEALIKAWNTKS